MTTKMVDPLDHLGSTHRCNLLFTEKLITPPSRSGSARRQKISACAARLLFEASCSRLRVLADAPLFLLALDLILFHEAPVAPGVLRGISTGALHMNLRNAEVQFGSPGFPRVLGRYPAPTCTDPGSHVKLSWIGRWKMDTKRCPTHPQIVLILLGDVGM